MHVNLLFQPKTHSKSLAGGGGGGKGSEVRALSSIRKLFALIQTKGSGRTVQQLSA